MIQRIQTIWLFLATVVFLALFLFPYVQILNDNGSAKVLKVSGVYENLNNQVVRTDEFLGLTIATVVIGLLPILIIWSFKNRSKQLSLCYMTIVAILGYSFWLAYTTKSVIGDFKLQPQNYGIGVLLPSIAILFIVLAIRGIRSDERLVKSTERLRG